MKPCFEWEKYDHALARTRFISPWYGLGSWDQGPSLPLLYPVGVFGRLGGFTRMIQGLHTGGPLVFVAVCVEFGIGVCF